MTPRRALVALRPAFVVAAITAGGLAVPAAAVLRLGDGSCFTAPPEAVAEQFVRKLALARWAPARAHLTPALAARVDEAMMRAARQRFEERWSAVRAVEGQPGPRSGDQAWASALVTTARGQRVAIALPLLRQQGEWHVASLEPIIQAR
jgi:hypothetical protein